MRTLTILPILAASLLLTAVAPAPAQAQTPLSLYISTVPTRNTGDLSWFRFTVTGATGNLECSLDGAPYFNCGGGWSFQMTRGITSGVHTMRVYDRDHPWLSDSHTWDAGTLTASGSAVATSSGSAVASSSRDGMWARVTVFFASIFG